MVWMIFTKILKNTISNQKRKHQSFFDDMIADVLSNKKRNPIVTELFVRGKELNISVFITKSFFAVSKNIRLNSMHCFIMKFSNK